MMSAAFYARQRHILLGPGELLRDELDAVDVRRLDRRARLGVLRYAVATAGALASAHVTLGICALIALNYSLPATVCERRAVRTPAPEGGA